VPKDSFCELISDSKLHYSQCFVQLTMDLIIPTSPCKYCFNHPDTSLSSKTDPSAASMTALVVSTLSHLVNASWKECIAVETVSAAHGVGGFELS
jgi:hypothetical protein